MSGFTPTASSASPPRPASPRHAGRTDPDTRVRPRGACLSAAEERALAEAVARGDADARERFIRANLGLVRIIAPLYRDMGLDLTVVPPRTAQRVSSTLHRERRGNGVTRPGVAFSPGTLAHGPRPAIRPSRSR